MFRVKGLLVGVYGPSSETIPAEVAALQKALDPSAAWQFVQDPEAFIKSLGRG